MRYLAPMINPAAHNNLGINIIILLLFNMIYASVISFALLMSVVAGQNMTIPFNFPLFKQVFFNMKRPLNVLHFKFIILYFSCSAIPVGVMISWSLKLCVVWGV